MTDERAKEIAEQLRRGISTDGGASTMHDERDLFLVKLYDDLEMIKKGVSYLGIGGGIKPVQRVDG